MANVRHLGDYIRDQRRDSNVSLRQLAKLAGVSNPYLSQIERGLRKPSAEILQQIAKALRISAEALYVQAGILEQREGSGAVRDAILGDEALNERQKQVLIEIYDSFRKENAANPAAAGVAVITTVPASEASTGTTAGAAEPLATKKAPAKRPSKAAARPRKAAPAEPAEPAAQVAQVAQVASPSSSPTDVPTASGGTS